jgi:hypothetical protein
MEKKKHPEREAGLGRERGQAGAAGLAARSCRGVGRGSKCGRRKGPERRERGVEGGVLYLVVDVTLSELVELVSQVTLLHVL